MSELEIEYQNLEALIPYVSNPRDNDEAVDMVAGSISEFGFKNPIIVDGENVIVAGHTRLLAARKLGMEEVPTLRADDLTPQQIRAFRIADNKTAEFADWDTELLENELRDLDGIFTGFDQAEIDEIMDLEAEVEEDDFDEDEEVPPRSKEGEIYQLGEHRLMCGDATKEADVLKLMDGAKADLAITDPPYNVDYEGGTGLTIQNDKMEDAAFIQFLTDAFRQMSNALKEGGAYYIWHADTNRHAFSRALLENGMKERQNLIWVKSSLVMGRQDYQWKHEPCLYGWKPGAAHYFIDDFTNTTILGDTANINTMTKDQLKNEIKELRKIIDAGTTIIREDKPSASDLHPTMKPLKLIAENMKNSSRVGEIIIDLFGGSGSTLITAEQLNRKAYLMELDPKYVDVIISRWEDFTGEEAILLNGAEQK